MGNTRIDVLVPLRHYVLECFLLYVVLRALENGVVHTDCDADQAERTGPGREDANY